MKRILSLIIAVSCQDKKGAVANFLFYPPVKKFPGAQHLVNALPVIAAAGKFMRTAGMPHILNRSSQYFQTAVKHFTLHKAGAPIVISMKNNVGRGNILYIGNR